MQQIDPLSKTVLEFLELSERDRRAVEKKLSSADRKKLKLATSRVSAGLCARQTLDDCSPWLKRHMRSIIVEKSQRSVTVSKATLDAVRTALAEGPPTTASRRDN